MLNSDESNYRLILKRELDQRRKKNPAYSLRSFARDLQVSPSRLSDVMRGRYGISREAAEKIAKRLGYLELDIQKFAALVEVEKIRQKEKKKMERIKTLSGPVDFRQLSLDSFRVISEWYHYAILELLEITELRRDYASLAKRLNITPEEFVLAIDRLRRLGLVSEVDGVLKPSEGFTASPDGVPSDAIKKFHQQLLEKALLAIHSQSLDERDISSMTLAIDTAKIPEAKKELQHFRRSFSEKFGVSENRNRVYCLGLQFFSLEQTEHAT